ncbi:MAG: tyrosine-type recombinase/integrase [Eubacteriales bacterium]|nr:tyrosine-type recombinase/integrase [Eubacteriales bacterium]
MEHLLRKEMLEEFRRELEEDEKAAVTIEKYMRDVKTFWLYAGEENPVDKGVMIAYKEHLVERYCISSVNSMLAAVNVFLKWLGWYDCTVKSLKVQKEAFRAGEKELSREEYRRLLDAAKSTGKIRLYLIMQTLCSAGLRVSELPYVTAESLRTGRAQVYAKGKGRVVLLSESLCKKLRQYAQEQGIETGSLFVTRSGRPVDRSNIGHEMKALCRAAGVSEEKVFPHNLRHLFATQYYETQKDLSHLADLLGHSSVNTTRIYTLVSSKEQERQIEALGLVV